MVLRLDQVSPSGLAYPLELVLSLVRLLPSRVMVVAVVAVVGIGVGDVALPPHAMSVKTLAHRIMPNAVDLAGRFSCIGKRGDSKINMSST